MKNLTQADVVNALHYCPDTGLFTWKPKNRQHFKTDASCKRWNTRRAGKPAGCKRKDGYVIIGLGDKLLYAHRLAWLWMTGDWAAEDVDHINHNPSDNRWVNLRAVSHAENQRNMKLSQANSTGYTGVQKNRKTGKWIAQFTINGSRGGFSTHENIDAAIEWRAKANKHYGFHLNHGAQA